jgi:hypothetical protein
LLLPPYFGWGTFSGGVPQGCFAKDAASSILNFQLLSVVEYREAEYRPFWRSGPGRPQISSFLLLFWSRYGGKNTAYSTNEVFGKQIIR